MASKNENHWVPLADLMTVLMIIFLFLTISYIAINKKKQKEKDSLIENYEKTRIELLKELNVQFNEDFKSSKWNAVLDTNNLSIRFVDESILFDYNKSDLKPAFKAILNDFLPRYLKIVMQEKYKGKIGEIRIEGHTSEEGGYIYNLNLSQERTRNVMEYLLNLKHVNDMPLEQRKLLTYILTANGLSFGKTLDNNGDYCFKTKKISNPEKCRRVEFRIVTTSDDVIKQAVKNINK
jgi:outer membrane protein OmpA-like peptidoglycan-associated protein